MKRINMIEGSVAIKKLSILFMTFIIFISLSACNKSEENPYDDIITQEDIVIEELEPVELNFYSRGYGSSGKPREIAEIENMLEQVEKELQNTLKVIPRFHWIAYEEYDQKLIELIKSGE